MNDPTTIPVIVGVGEVVDRPLMPDRGLEPLELMRAATRAADVDAGGGFSVGIDHLYVVNQISWPYTAPAHELALRLGLVDAKATYGAVGGETPLRFLQDAANAIASGRSRIAAVCGGEAHRTVAEAARAGIELPWARPTGEAAPSVRGQDTADPLARALNLHRPVTVYPLFENAQNQRWGLSPREALDETAAMWSSMASVAASNPSAWVRREYAPEEIRETSSANRPIAHPYSKLMVANINVNQGTAILVTSLAMARSAGLDDGRLVFLHRSAFAAEPANYLVRDDYGDNRARTTVLEAARHWAPSHGFDTHELYSCFPCVPKAARRTLGLETASEITVAGGLSFFGAPLNNYMSHAACAMVRRLRGGSGEGLLYGQGGFATKHHALTLGARPPTDVAQTEFDLNAEAACRYGPVPTWRPEATGPAVVETYTVIHERDGQRHGAIVARTPEGGRSLGRVDPDDAAGIDLLENLSTSPIGRSGRLIRSSDAVAQWRFE